MPHGALFVTSVHGAVRVVVRPFTSFGAKLVAKCAYTCGATKLATPVAVFVIITVSISL